MAETTLEIIQGLSQAAANAYDGGHDERFSLDGQIRKVGLKREEGCPIMDSRVNDGFSVKFYGNKICINWIFILFNLINIVYIISYTKVTIRFII